MFYNICFVRSLLPFIVLFDQAAPDFTIFSPLISEAGKASKVCVVSGTAGIRAYSAFSDNVSRTPQMVLPAPCRALMTFLAGD